MARYLYSELASLIEARKNCAEKMARLNPNAVSATVEMRDNDYHQTKDWLDRHEETIEKLVSQHLPHGSGYNSGTKIDFDASHADKLVFETGFHHMDENGYYDGWTEHTVTVTPSLSRAFNLRISGRNRNDIKEMMYQDFDCALHMDVTYDLLIERYPEFTITHKWEDKNGTPSQCYQAWYVGAEPIGGWMQPNSGRFWNDYQGARAFAAAKMEAKMYAR